MNKFTTLFGDKLLTKDGEVETTTALSGIDSVAIYFSAHWCPPCRKFTPELSKKYNALKAAGKKFEIIFASSDKDEAAFNGYFAEMPWLALPFSKRDLKNTLASDYECNGIPYLVILDGENAETITLNGRKVVTEVNYLESFPWKPVPMSINQFPTELLKNSTGEMVSTADALKGVDVLGIYFSAHWCPPCKAFTPKCAKSYNALKEAGKKVEIIFASGDVDETSFKEYFAEMPWLAMPFEFRKEKEDLSERYECEGIPYLVFVNPQTWETITKSGTGIITSENFVEDFPYTPKTSYDLSENTEGLMGSKNIFMVFTDEIDKESQKAIYNTVREMADAAREKGETVIDKWFTGNGSSGIEGQMRPSFGLENSGPPKKHEHDMEKITKEDNIGPY